MFQTFIKLQDQDHLMADLEQSAATRLKHYILYYKHSTPPRGISMNIAYKVGIFPEAEGRGKYSLPSTDIPRGRVEYLIYYIS